MLTGLQVKTEFSVSSGDRRNSQSSRKNSFLTIRKAIFTNYLYCFCYVHFTKLVFGQYKLHCGFSVYMVIMLSKDIQHKKINLHLFNDMCFVRYISVILKVGALLKK